MKAETPAEINELFDPIAYEKGAAVVRMLEAWLGEEAFRAGVNAYIERYKYANARDEDFGNTLAQSTGQPVYRVMRTFVEQPGVPLVSAEVKCDNGGTPAYAMLSQERYLRDPSAAPGDERWQIPVCLRGSTGKTVCELLDTKHKNIGLDACPSWIVANAGGRGYYRTAVSADAVRRIGAAIDAMPGAERMTLLADEWALARSIRHDIGTFLDLAGGFRAERSDAVMRTLTTPLATIGDYVTSPPALPKFRAWVSSLLSGTLQAVGWTPGSQESDETRALRATVVAALGDTARDPQVLAKARELVSQELEKPGTIDSTLLDVLVRLAALEGDSALYDRYLARAKAATDPDEKYRYLYGLAAFANPALVRRTVDLILSPDVRSQDAKLFVAMLFRSPDARGLAWELIRRRWPELQKKTGEFVGNTVIVSALAGFCDAEASKGIREFFESNRVPDAERTLQQALERIDDCARFVTAQRPRLDAWLR